MAGNASIAYYLETVGCDRLTATAVASAAVSSGEDPVVVPVTEATKEAVVQPAVAPASTVSSPAVVVDGGWQALALKVEACVACDLSVGRSQTVFGSGDERADLLLIGEAPGRDEDQQGEPIVGREGCLLNQMLAAIGLARQQVQVINVVKCRPPQNRDPKPEEIAACRHFINAQIAVVQPKVIGLLGRVAACAMLGIDAPLSVSRHRWHVVEGTPTYVTYHPAFLLRSAQQKAEGWHDMLQIQQRLRLLTSSSAAS